MESVAYLTGVHPMGLFSRMSASDPDAIASGKLHDTLMVKDVGRDMDFRLRAYQGHLTGEEKGTTEVSSPSDSGGSSL